MNADALLAAVRARRAATSADARMALALMAGSDLATRRHLVALAAPALQDGAVIADWIAVAAVEPDDALRAALIVRVCTIDPAVIPIDAHAAWHDLLLAALALPAARCASLAALRGVLPATPALAERLITVLPDLADRTTRALADDLLLGLSRPSPAVLAWWRQRLAAGAAAVRPRLVAALLERDALDEAAITALLAPGEPVAVRRLVLAHWHDRGMAPAAALAGVLREDGDAECRRVALAIAVAVPADPVVVAALQQVARHDPEGTLRAAAVRALAETPAMGPPDEVLALLREEGTGAIVADLVTALGPGLARTADGRQALLTLLTPTVHPGVAVAVIHVLGPWARTDDALCTGLLDVYERLPHTQVREAVLTTLTGLLRPDAAQAEIILRALRSPDADLRTWGVAGFLRLDVAAVNGDLIAAAAARLARLGPGGGWAQGQERRHLLRKLAVGRPLPEVVQRLAVEDSEDEIRRLASVAVQDASGDGAAIPWEDWYERIAVRRDAAGVMPAIFAVVDENRAAAARILYAAAMALLGDGLANTRIGVATLVPWLAGLDAIDPTLVRAAALHLRGLDERSGDANSLLALMRAHPEVDEVLPTVAQVLTRREDLEAGLLRRLVHAACGRDAAAMVAWFHRQLLAVGDPRVGERLFKLLERGEAWIEPDAILQAWHGSLARRPGGERLGRDIAALAKRWKIPLEEEPAPQRGGLLDDE